jgi:hypothetical protein
VPEDSQSGDSPPQGGVFGNLPDTRPGTRSPRRRSGGAEREAKPAAKKAAPRTASPERPKRAPKAEPSPPSPPPTPRSGEGAPAARGEGIAGIEDLAWAGVAAAAEAATLGVRIASRALDALRGSAERD